ncbi:hypothetical protein SODALDRAFT_1479 [Sodiomyces alkalinus F11]|uniref:Uncharacterized protein n=1 Tax=Sodiomyces alkalinus (strain CBS 110278 / VKM F-3762 / F11) TaxID=1314773 RepID=A0A3N2Q571_SODAK|nr:hypothetical protein SODALDRAFT_1479 [Sodiomyces alkalinus F11]ROT41846.1 hypothetical protein SODALDRAFT_1479 [Sodiomyces alkalinus F11]
MISRYQPPSVKPLGHFGFSSFFSFFFFLFLLFFLALTLTFPVLSSDFAQDAQTPVLLSSDSRCSIHPRMRTERNAGISNVDQRRPLT